MAVITYLGIGSNREERRKNIYKAMRLLQNEGVKIKKTSRIIETKPVGGPKQPNFLNTVIKAQSNLNPYQLLNTLKKIEKIMGRKKAVRNGPRIIDLDILFYGDKNIKSKKLTIPHPRMIERDFVMIPLVEIAPGIVKKLIKCI